MTTPTPVPLDTPTPVPLGRARYLNPPPIPPETAEAAADEADEADRRSGAHPTHRGPFAGLRHPARSHSNAPTGTRW